MVWLIALLCLGCVGLAGYYRGPVCAAFSLVGLMFGILLSGPLAPLAQRLLPVLGFHHPLWQLFVPRVIAFLVVLIIFKIVGNALHQKLTLHYKYQRDENLYFRWERMYHRLGFCVGLLNGTVYFFLLMMPVYIGGYFATEAAGAAGTMPPSVQLLTRLRTDLHDSNLDRVLAAHDPIPPEIYQASDIIDLVLHNPLLESRLAHYPPLLALGERKEIQDLAGDVQLQQLLASQAKLADILNYPKIQALVTNVAVTEEVRALVGHDLTDLQGYLNTGKSPKYGAEEILGVWKIDPAASVAEERRRNPNMSARQLAALRTTLVPLISGLSLTALPDHQIILKKLNPDTTQTTAVGQGTWKKAGDNYEITMGNNNPDMVDVTLQEGTVLPLMRDGHLLLFNKEL